MITRQESECRADCGSLRIRRLTKRLVLVLLVFQPLLSDCCPAQTLRELSISEDRLAALSPDSPQDYRDLAEECSVIEGSPQAKNLTVRLYLIAAKHSSGAVRRSSFRGLIAAARNKEEKKKFVLLAFQNDSMFSDHLLRFKDPAVDRSTNKKKESQTDSEPELQSRLTDSLRSFRQGKFARAKKLMAESDVQQLIVRYYPEFSAADFNRMCDSGVVSDTALLKTLELEREIRGNEPGKQNSSSPGQQTDWQSAFQGKLPARVPQIDFSSVTEFDPAKSIFVNGVWRSPQR